MRLVAVIRALRPDKKYLAIFDDGLKVHFGARGYVDYTMGATDEQRTAYRNRHKSDLLTGDARRPGFLSYYILWGDNRDIRKNITDYKKMFNL